MKRLLTLILSCSLVTLSADVASADGERYETVTISASPIATNGFNSYQYASTNFINILEGETGELITVETGRYSAGGPAALVKKNDVTIIAYPSSGLSGGLSSWGSNGTTIAGPASFMLVVENNSASSPQIIKGLMTVRITPMTYASDKTVLVAPGMGNVSIRMQSSTNLNQWTDATNGVYSDDMRFFRIKLEKAN